MMFEYYDCASLCTRVDHKGNCLIISRILSMAILAKYSTPWPRQKETTNQQETISSSSQFVWDHLKSRQEKIRVTPKPPCSKHTLLYCHTNKNVRVQFELENEARLIPVSANRCYILIETETETEYEHGQELVLPCYRRALVGEFGLRYVWLMIG